MLPSVRKVPRLAERVESSIASPARFHNRSRFFHCQTPNLILESAKPLANSLNALSHIIPNKRKMEDNHTPVPSIQHFTCLI